MADLAVDVDPLRAQHAHGLAQPLLGPGISRLAELALRGDDQEARRRAAGPLADGVEQLLAEDGLVRDHEHVVGAFLGGEVDHDVLDGDVDGRADALHDVAAQPAGARLRVRGDDNRVRRRHELAERVPDDVDGVRVDDEAVGCDPVLAQELERPVEPPTRRRHAACPRRRRSRSAATRQGR